MLNTYFKKHITFIAILLLNIHVVKAQPGKEAWHWQFGNNLSLDFSSGVPVPGTSAIHAHEGSASVSDPNTGQLLFYTDGDSAWNRKDQLMPHGVGMIGGANTTTQAALIVPKPGNPMLYYLISADNEGANQGIHYSIVDISLNGGLGDVTVKNILLTPPITTEKLTAVPHCNGIDYWIITHSFNSNAFNAYLLTQNGISPTPIISQSGTVEQSFNGNYSESDGYLKASPNGKKLALGLTEDLFITEIFDFDNSSGFISNAITIADTNTFGYGPYGICFSPDNTKLYTSDGIPGIIHQYDLSSGVPATIIASKTFIALRGYWAMQSAPDGKIYATNASPILGVINNPNNPGIACNYQQTGVSFSTGYCQLGLPNFVQYNNNSPTLNIPDIVTCGTFTKDTLDAGTGFSNYFWSTGANTQSITVSNPGTYWVSVVTQNGCIATDTVHVNVIKPNMQHILNDSSICSSTGYYLANATTTGATNYYWNDSTTNSVNYISHSGIYWVDIKFGKNCVVRDSFKINLYSNPIAILPSDTLVCNTNSPIVLKAGNGTGNTYNWNTGATTQTISVKLTGIYSVTITSSEGCTASKTIYTYYYGNTKLEVDTSVYCMNQFPTIFNASVPTPDPIYTYYQWSNGYNTDTASITDTGRYYVFISFGACHLEEYFHITVHEPPYINLHDTSIDCDKLPLVVNVTSPQVIAYKWNDSFTEPIRSISIPGEYGVMYEYNSKCFTTFRSFTFTVNSKFIDILFPNIVTPNGDGINDEIDFYTYKLATLQIKIYDRWGTMVFESTDPNAIWKPTNDDGTYFYMAEYRIDCGVDSQSKSIKGFMTIIR
jgi:gliding motility-associated-like protein